MKHNSAYIFIKKSERKNSKISDIINIYNITDSKEEKNEYYFKQQFINTLEKIIYNIKKINTKKLIIDYSIVFEKNNKNSIDNIFYGIQHKEFECIYDLIKELYIIFYMLYPDNKISLQEIYNNSSIKYFIKEYEKYINEGM